MISTRKLAQLSAAGHSIDVAQQRIHTLLLRRLMYLESKYLGSTRHALMRDPVYSRYLDPAGFETIVAASSSVDEHIE